MKCPYCNYINTEHETLEGDRNFKDGDISFCINCGEAGIYEGNSIIKVDIKELPEENKSEVQDLRHAWLKMKTISKVK